MIGRDTVSNKIFNFLVSGVLCREVLDSTNPLLNKYWCDHLETNKFEGLPRAMAIKTKYVLFKVALIAGTGA